MKERTLHPMFSRLLRIADHLQEHGIGVGDETDDGFVREAAHELEHLKRLNEQADRTYETLIKLTDSLQRQLDIRKEEAGEPGIASRLFMRNDPLLEECGHVMLDLVGACKVAHKAMQGVKGNEAVRKAMLGIEYAVARLRRPAILDDMLSGVDVRDEFKAGTSHA